MWHECLKRLAGVPGVRGFVLLGHTFWADETSSLQKGWARTDARAQGSGSEARVGVATQSEALAQAARRYLATGRSAVLSREQSQNLESERFS